MKFTSDRQRRAAHAHMNAAKGGRNAPQQPRTTVTKTQSHLPVGEYKRTPIDDAKDKADFRLLQTSPYIIRWKGGKTETVRGNKLKALQKKHTWEPDF